MGVTILDTIKIHILPEYVEICDGKPFFDLFRADCQKFDGRAGKRLVKGLLPPAVEKIEYYEEQGELPAIFEMKLSSKILGRRYPEGISLKTIHLLPQIIRNTTGIDFQLEGLLNATVHIVHVVKNCLIDEPEVLMDVLNSIHCINPKFKVESLGRTSLLYLAKAASRREKLNIYYKYPEIRKDRQIYDVLDRAGFDWARRNIRAELRLSSHKDIRKRLGSNVLKDILLYDGNPVSEVFNEIFKGVDLGKSHFMPSNLNELGLEALIKLHHGDLGSIRRAVSTITDKSNLSKRMRKIIEMQGIMESQMLREAGFSSYFNEFEIIVNKD